MSTPSKEPSRRKVTLDTLPTEVIECIIAKCIENDAEAHEAKTTNLVENVQLDNAGSKDPRPDNEDGWETEEEDGNDSATGWETSEDDLEPDDDFWDQHSGDLARPERRSRPRSCSAVMTENDLKKTLAGGDTTRLLCGHEVLLAIRQLALVNKRLRSLVLPHVHAGIDFEGNPNRALSRCLSIIVPKYGHYVKQIWLRVSINENEEFADVDPEDLEDEDGYQPSTRYRLASEILAALPNLTSIDIDIPSRNAEGYPHDSPDRTFENLIMVRADKLTRLALTGDIYDSRLLTNQLCPILQKLTKLEALELTGVDLQSSDGSSLRDVISGMEHLRYLELADVLALTDDWADAEWKSSLRTLNLDDCQNITDKGVEKLLQCHSATLRVITLEMVPYLSADALNQGPPYDFPKLQELSLESGELRIEYLKRFSMCPNLYRVQLGPMEEMSVRELSTMVEKARETSSSDPSTSAPSTPTEFPALKDLILSYEWSDFEGTPAMESFQLLCFQSGISLSIEDPDSDDDMSDDGDEYSDEDEYHLSMAEELALEMDQDFEGVDDDFDDDEDDDDETDEDNEGDSDY